MLATEAPGGLSSGAVAGIAVSTALVAGVIAVVVVVFLLKKKQLKHEARLVGYIFSQGYCLCFFFSFLLIYSSLGLGVLGLVS